MFGVSAVSCGREIGFRQFQNLMDALQFAGALRARFYEVHLWVLDYDVWWEVEFDNR